MEISRVGIILKQDSDKSRRIGVELVDWLRERSIDSSLDQITDDMDLLIILGGDGTLLHVACQASRFKIPVVGFVALCPPAIDGLSDEVAKAASDKEIRGTIITGKTDQSYEAQKKIIATFKRSGLDCKFEVSKDLGHWYPEDLDVQIDKALAHIFKD